MTRHTGPPACEPEGVTSTLLALILAGCTGTEPRPEPRQPGSGTGSATWDPWVATELDVSTQDALDQLGPADPAPWDRDLLVDAGFESVYGPTWQITAGTCAKADGTDTYTPYSGRLAWWGGDDHCETSQRLDLLARGFSADDLDRGDVGFELSGWLKNGSPPGDFESRDFDDQVVLRLDAVDAADEVMATWETMGSGDQIWIQRSVQGLLPAGTRAVDVSVIGTWRRGEVHDSLADELALVLSPRVLGTPEITKGPMLTEARTDGTMVLWETDHPWASSGFWWSSGGGEVSAPVTTTQVDEDRFVHRATVAGLAPETPVTYQLDAGGQRSEAASFETLALPGNSVTVGFFADNQLGPDQLTLHLDMMAPEDPDAIIAVGDIVQEGWRLEDWDELWFAPLDGSGLFRSRPVIVVRGNHDGEYPEAYAYSHVPGDNGAWYAQTLGDLFLVVLDSEAPTDGEQLAFLEDALASDEALDASFVAVTFHRTAWSNTRDLAWGHHLDSARTDWEPVFEAHGVDLVIAGHHHSYQRGTQNGVIYLVVGGAGNFLDEGHWDQFEWIEIEEIVHHHTMMTVTADQLSWTAIREDGSLMDSFELTAE